MSARQHTYDQALDAMHREDRHLIFDAAASSVFDCPHCGDGDALRPGEACAYCGEWPGLDAWMEETNERNQYKEDERP